MYLDITTRGLALLDIDKDRLDTGVDVGSCTKRTREKESINRQMILPVSSPNHEIPALSEKRKEEKRSFWSEGMHQSKTGGTRKLARNSPLRW